MSETRCPFCDKKPTKNPLKTWKYGMTEVQRLQCECGKVYNSYKSMKSTWTIPKKK